MKYIKPLVLERIDSSVINEISTLVDELIVGYFKHLRKTIKDYIATKPRQPLDGYPVYSYTYKPYTDNCIVFEFSLIEREETRASYAKKRGYGLLRIYDNDATDTIFSHLRNIKQLMDENNYPNMRRKTGEYDFKKNRKRALEYVDMMIQFTDWKVLKRSIFHELVHHKDFLIHDHTPTELKKRAKLKKFFQSSDFSDQEKLDKHYNFYYNTTAEVNAHFLDAIFQYEQAGKTHDTFDDMKDHILAYYYRAYEYLNPSNQKKVMKRLYDYYQENKSRSLDQ